MHEDENPELELSPEDLELIQIYGAKIRCVQWFFENDKNVKQRADLGEGDEEEGNKYEFFNGIGYSLLSE